MQRLACIQLRHKNVIKYVMTTFQSYFYRFMSTVERSTADCAKNNSENHKIKLNAQEGHLSNPGYPEYFPDNIQCTWFISVARRHAIELEFEFFDIGNHTSCSERGEGSFLEIHDGPDRDSRSLGLFCGKTKPERIVSSGRKMLVRFNAKGCGTSTKFKANYRAVKGKGSFRTLFNHVYVREKLLYETSTTKMFTRKRQHNCKCAIHA